MIDATGLVVAPGFIDLLGQSEYHVLVVGFRADLTLFDPKTVASRATFEDPNLYSQGIPYVAVNGELVVDEGRITDARPGQALRGPGYAGGR